jgi:HEAT repeat protein
VLREQLDDLARTVDRLLRAGAAQAAGDRRLRQACRMLQGLAEQAPALRPLAEAAERLAGSEGVAARALLDLHLGLRQARGGLAGAGGAGELTPAEPSGPWATGLSPPDMRTAQEGVYSATDSGTFLLEHLADFPGGADLRLLGPLLDHLGSEADAGEGDEEEDPRLGDRIAEHALPVFGPALAPELRRAFNPRGGKKDQRRLAALCKIDAREGEALCRAALEQGDEAMRLRALRCLGERDPAAAAEAALALLTRDKVRGALRDDAIRTLEGGRSEAPLRWLLQAATTGKEVFEYAVRNALWGAEHPAAAERLVQELGPAVAAGNFRAVSRLAEVLLLRGRPAGLRAAVALLQHPSAEVRGAAAGGFDRLRISWEASRGREIIPELTAALASKDARVREQAVSTLCRVLRAIRDEGGARAPDLARALNKAAVALLPLLNDKKVAVRQAAVTALGLIPTPPEPVVQALAAALGDPSRSVREWAARALEDLGPAAGAAVPALVKALDDPHWEVGRFAADALRCVGPAALTAVKALRARLRHPSAGARYQAAATLVRILRADPPALVQALKDKQLSEGAVSALTEAAVPNGAVTAALTAIALDRDHPARKKAILALGKAGPAAKAAAPALAELMRRGSGDLRRLAAEALASVRPAAKPSAVVALREALRDPDPQERREAAEALRRIAPGSETMLPVLVQLLDDESSRVCAEAADALGEMGPAAKAAAPALAGALKNSDLYARWRAAVALRAIQGTPGHTP